MNLQHAVQHSLNVSLTRFYTNKPAGTRRLTPTPGLFRHCPCQYNHNQEPKECVHSHLWTLETLTPYLHQLSACAQTHFRCTKKGEGPIFKYIGTKLENKFLTSQDKYFQPRYGLEPEKCGRAHTTFASTQCLCSNALPLYEKRGRGQYSGTKPENEFLSSQDEYFPSRYGLEPEKCGRAPKQIVLCIVLAVGPLPIYVHLASTWCHSCDECSQVFPVLIFHRPSVLLWRQRDDQNGEAWERGYNSSTCHCLRLGPSNWYSVSGPPLTSIITPYAISATRLLRMCSMSMLDSGWVVNWSPSA